MVWNKCCRWWCDRWRYLSWRLLVLSHLIDMRFDLWHQWCGYFQRIAEMISWTVVIYPTLKATMSFIVQGIEMRHVIRLFLRQWWHMVCMVIVCMLYFALCYGIRMLDELYFSAGVMWLVNKLIFQREDDGYQVLRRITSPLRTMVAILSLRCAEHI